MTNIKIFMYYKKVFVDNLLRSVYNSVSHYDGVLSLRFFRPFLLYLLYYRGAKKPTKV